MPKLAKSREQKQDAELKGILGRIDEAQKAKPDINELIPSAINERI